MKFWQRLQKRKRRRCWGVNLKVLVDEREIELPAEARLADALKEAGASPAVGAIVGVVKGRGEKSRQTNSYWLNTTKGKLRIELLENELQGIWHENLDRIQGSRVRWSSADAIAFGPFASNLSFGRDAHEYNRWEIVLGAAGFDAENTQLIFVQRRHTAAYGTPPDGGVLAHVVGGKNTLDRLEAGDKIVMYSDGLTEARNAEREFYGLKRLCAVLNTQAGASCQQLHAAILSALDEFTGRAPQSDDISLAVLEYRPE